LGSILEKIEQALKDMLIGWIESNLTNMFTDVNEKVGTIAAEVGQTPSGWNGGVYQMIRGLSENVIVPIAGIIITFVLCYELISMITEKNNLHDMDTWMFFKWFFKAAVAIYLVTHTFDIVMAVFDIGQNVVSGAAGVIHGNTSIDIDSTIAQMRTGMENMGVGELLGLSIETLLISLCLKIMAILITVILYGRMIEIYCTVSIAPIFHLRRDLRILDADDQFIRFQLLEVRAEGLVGDGFQIPFQLIESHRLKLHQAVKNDHLVLAGDQRQRVGKAGVLEIGVLNVIFYHSTFS